VVGFLAGAGTRPAARCGAEGTPWLECKSGSGSPIGRDTFAIIYPLVERQLVPARNASFSQRPLILSKGPQNARRSCAWLRCRGFWPGTATKPSPSMRVPLASASLIPKHELLIDVSSHCGHPISSNDRTYTQVTGTQTPSRFSRAVNLRASYVPNAILSGTKPHLVTNTNFKRIIPMLDLFGKPIRQIPPPRTFVGTPVSAAKPKLCRTSCLQRGPPRI